MALAVKNKTKQNKMDKASIACCCCLEYTEISWKGIFAVFC